MGDPEPPVALVYHLKGPRVPGSINPSRVRDVPDWQTAGTGAVMGAAGMALIRTLISARGPSQLLSVWLT